MKPTISEVEQNGLTAQGKTELLKFMQGKELTRREAMVAKCYECNNYYADGKSDCEVSSCPMYGYMPFNKNRYKGKPATEEQKNRMAQMWEKRRQTERTKT